jgi:enoyl-CoA hydratase/carnithine racemase
MPKLMRQSTLLELGIPSVLDIVKLGRMPITASDLIDEFFGPATKRGSLVISGGSGIVGSGKAIQLSSVLEKFNVPIITLDLPGSPNGLTEKHHALSSKLGLVKTTKIMTNIIRMHYDGKEFPLQLRKLNPRFFLEAIPEVLDIKKAHYQLLHDNFPGANIYSVTSGFPSQKLGVPIAHPSFPHQINKVWEIVDTQPSRISQLLWSLGMIPIPVDDRWSFVLDVLFCGLTLAGLRYHEVTNVPFWKIDKYVRKLLGANPFRVHDIIGAKGSNFLTWSCLHHLAQQYGDLFKPTRLLEERKGTGQNWYPLDHFRPLVDWSLSDLEEEVFRVHILGPFFQMLSILLKENRAGLVQINAIGELCANLRQGPLAYAHRCGSNDILQTVSQYHKQYPELKNHWYPEVFDEMVVSESGWQQLYVNAEHDGKIGVITIGREQYNTDVDNELNRAINWLLKEKIEKVVITTDFHLASQMLGADISEFFQALSNAEVGFSISYSWSKTARRLYDLFKVSIGFIKGKRCLGGSLELLSHCHYLVSVDEAIVGMPEVTLPVIPGMEGCHWLFRKTELKDWPNLLKLLLDGELIKAKETVPWLIDYSGSLDKVLEVIKKILGDETYIKQRCINSEPIKMIAEDLPLSCLTSELVNELSRKAIFDCILDSCNHSLSEALIIQSHHSANFMLTSLCHEGKIGTYLVKNM